PGIRVPPPRVDDRGTRRRDRDRVRPRGLSGRPVAGLSLGRGCCSALRGHRVGLAGGRILGATVMPHVIYLHSALTQKRVVGANPVAKRKIFRYEMIDITIAMGLAGIINLAMLATAAAVFHSRGLFGVGDDLEQVFSGLKQ